MDENRKPWRPPFQLPMKKRIPMPAKGIVPSPQQVERMRVIAYLQGVHVEGMRKHLCFSCAFVTLYDKNNKQYRISRTSTLEQVKEIIQEIIKINAQ